MNAERIESSLAVGAKDVGVRSLDIGVASVCLSVTKDAAVATAEGSVFTDAVYDAAEGASEVIVKDGAASVVHTQNETQCNASRVAEMSSCNLNFKSADVDVQVFGVAHHPVAKEATFEIAGVGVVCTQNKTQGNAIGAAKNCIKKHQLQGQCRSHAGLQCYAKCFVESLCVW